MRRKRYLLQESSKIWELKVKVKNEENRLKKINSSSQQLEQDQFDAYFVPKFDMTVRKQRNGKNRQLRNDFINSIEGLD